MANMIWEQRLIFYSAINSIYIHLRWLFVVVELQLRSLHCALPSMYGSMQYYSLAAKSLEIKLHPDCMLCLHFRALSLPRVPDHVPL